MQKAREGGRTKKLVYVSRSELALCFVKFRSIADKGEDLKIMRTNYLIFALSKHPPKHSGCNGLV